MAFSLPLEEDNQAKVIKLSGKCNMDKLEILMTSVLVYIVSTTLLHKYS